MKMNKELQINIFKGILIFVTVIFCWHCIQNCIDSMDTYQFEKESAQELEQYEELLDKQADTYAQIVEPYLSKENSNKEPYLPEDFHYIEGEKNTGYVIEDSRKNQFVWVPCSVNTLKKTDLTVDTNISAWSCYDENFEDFLKSALENGGFYVSRYEIGNGEDLCVSKSNADKITNITREEAFQKASTMYENIHSTLLNGYAYDAMLTFVMDGKSRTECQILNKEGKMTQNIANVFDGIFEMTSENFYEYMVYRGFFEDALDKDVMLENIENRMTAEVDSKKQTIGFRVMLYL